MDIVSTEYNHKQISVKHFAAVQMVCFAGIILNLITFKSFQLFIAAGLLDKSARGFIQNPILMQSTTHKATWSLNSLTAARAVRTLIISRQRCSSYNSKCLLYFQNLLLIYSFRKAVFLLWYERDNNIFVFIIVLLVIWYNWFTLDPVQYHINLTQITHVRV